MVSHGQFELKRAHDENESKYVYFLLTAAAAGIAFAVQKTTGSALSPSHAFLAIAVLLWAASFWAGCRLINKVQLLFQLNIQLLELAEGNHQSGAKTPEELQAVKDKVRGSVGTVMSRAQHYRSLQFRLLVSGAVVFLVWHAYGMYVLSAGGT